VPEGQIQQVLRMMKQPTDAKLTLEIAQEVCQRNSSTVVIQGSIAQLGTQYSLILKAVNCVNGETLTSTEAQASDKSHALDALGKASSDIRKNLGESLGSIEKFDTRLQQATTSSLEALRAYSLGAKESAGHGESFSAIPFYQRAVKLDPNFATAYTALAIQYSNVGEISLAAETIQKAYELRDGVNQREKLNIEAHYHELFTGDLAKAQQVFEVWTRIYPRDWLPRNELGTAIFLSLGQYEKSLPELREALRLYPQSGRVYGGLISTLELLNRFDEVHSVVDEAKAKGLDLPEYRTALYELAFLQNDAVGMKQQVDFAMGKPGLEDQLRRHSGILRTAGKGADVFGPGGSVGRASGREGNGGRLRGECRAPGSPIRKSG
jgi:Flp pilus assembly protein TadD